jgi:hypothetical protein
MPVGATANVRQPDRSTLPAWPEDSVRFLQDQYSVTLHMEYLDYNPSVLEVLFGPEYVLALQFSRLFKPMWWMDGIRALQSATPSVQPVARKPGPQLPAGAGTAGDGERDHAVSPWGAQALESYRRLAGHVPAVAESQPQQLRHFASPERDNDV